MNLDDVVYVQRSHYFIAWRNLKLPHIKTHVEYMEKHGLSRMPRDWVNGIERLCDHLGTLDNKVVLKTLKDYVALRRMLE